MTSRRPSENDSNEEETETSGECSSSAKLNLIPYWFLAALRIVLTLVPQTGYIHPDEYFQSIEVLNGDIFNVAAVNPWEFNMSHPVRSIALPYLVMGLPLLVLRSLAPFLALWFNLKLLTPYLLLVVPRLACCLLSFTTDFCIYRYLCNRRCEIQITVETSVRVENTRTSMSHVCFEALSIVCQLRNLLTRICKLYGQNHRVRLMTLGSSYVMLVYGPRTFTNSIEMALTSLLIYLVASCMFKSDQVIYQDEHLRECYNRADNMKDRVRYHRQRLSLPWHSLSKVGYISTITVIGIFNRPTFFAFAFPSLFFWLLRGMGSQYIGVNDFNIRMVALVISALPSTALMILIDSFYFGRITFFEIAHRKLNIWSNFVLTPFNFIRYNLDTSNLSQHGIHPRLTHFLINIPLLYNVLGIYGLFVFCHFIYRGVRGEWSSLPRVQSIIGLMTASFLTPVAILSLIPHQEPRFLIPVTLPLVFLHSQRIRNISEKSTVAPKKENGYTAFLKAKVKPGGREGLLATWYIINIACTILFGFVHQGGIYPLVDHLSKEIEAKPRLTHLHLVTSHSYPIPLSLLQLKYGAKSATTFPASTRRYQRSQDVFTYELGSVEPEQVVERLTSLLSAGEERWAEKRLKYRLYYAVPGSRVGLSLTAALQQANLTASLESVFFPHLSVEALPSLPPPQLDSLPSQLALHLYRIKLTDTTNLSHQ